MKQRFCIALVLGFVVVAISCKKTKDKALIASLSGTVVNACNDSGLANITVYLQLYNAGSNYVNYQAVSNGAGGFTFSNLDLQSSGVYTSFIKVPSTANLTGTNKVFVDSMAKYPVILMAAPTSSQLTVFFHHRNLPLPHSDSIVTTLIQNTLNINIPNTFSWPSFTVQGNTFYTSNTITNMPMGWWHINSDTWVNAVHRHQVDSVYIGNGATQTFNISW